MTTFWMTWKPEGWPVEQLRELVDRFDQDSTADEPWRIQAHKKVKVGDRAFAFKQGDGPRGIFGVGTIIDAPVLSPELSPDPEKPQRFVTVRFTQLVDPTKQFLLRLEDLQDVLPKKVIEVQGSGNPLEPNIAAVLADRLHLPIEVESVNNTKNPAWNRDELILVLDAYVRWNGNPPAKTSIEIAELSQIMGTLRQVLGSQGDATLRNMNGVYMKLMNFRRFDPVFTSQGKSGLTRGGHLEKEIWDEFHSNPNRLAGIAAAIRGGLDQAVGANEAFKASDVDQIENIEEAVEGRVITVLHQRRERSSKLIEKRKAAVFKAQGKLICEVCEFDFEEVYGSRGKGYIECHHTKPVETLGDGTPTKPSDLALLCANCHRMIHAKRPWLTLADLKVCTSKSGT